MLNKIIFIVIVIVIVIDNKILLCTYKCIHIIIRQKYLINTQITTVTYMYIMRHKRRVYTAYYPAI